MEVGYCRVRMATRSDAKRAVLYALQVIEGGIADIRRPDRSRVIERRLDVRLVGPQERLLLAAPSSASKVVEEPKFVSTRSDDVHRMCVALSVDPVARIVESVSKLTQI